MWKQSLQQRFGGQAFILISLFTLKNACIRRFAGAVRVSCYLSAQTPASPPPTHVSVYLRRVFKVCEQCCVLSFICREPGNNLKACRRAEEPCECFGNRDDIIIMCVDTTTVRTSSLCCLRDKTGIRFRGELCTLCVYTGGNGGASR